MTQLSFRNLWIKLLVLVIAALGLELTLAQTPTSDTIIIQHAQGSTEVPKHPKRVVVIAEEMLELAWVVDMNVVGFAGGRVGSENITSEGTLNPETLVDTWFHHGDVAGITYVGSWTEPNLEAILALGPDLIIRSYWGQDGYEALSKIAPTLSFASGAFYDVDGAWKPALRKLAKIVDAETKVEQVIEDLTGLYGDLQGQLEEAGVFEKYPKIIVLSPFASGATYMYVGPRVAYFMLNMGFDYAYPGGEVVDAEEAGMVSAEQLLLVDGDTLILAVVSGTFEGKEQSLELMKRSKGLLITYQLEAKSPWSGPITDRQIAADLVERILSTTQ